MRRAAMFGVEYTTPEGKYFQLFRTLEEAQDRANRYACAGYPVTVFDYDLETDTYLEFYEV